MRNIKKIVFENMEALKNEAIRRGLALNQTDWCRKIGMQKQNYRQARLGLQAYIHEQIQKAVSLVGADYNFVFTGDKKGNKNTKKPGFSGLKPS